MNKTLPLVLGTAQLGMDYGIANKQGMPDYHTAYDIIEYALKCGIHTFDTAQAYGKSESVLGEILMQLSGKAPIDGRIEIISKINPETDHLNQKQMEVGLKKSLDRLKISQLYGFMLHNENCLNLWEKGLKDILLSFKKKGQIKYIGISVNSPSAALDSLDKPEIDIIQIPSNILDQRFETVGFLKQARKKKKKIYIRSIFLQGLLLMDQDHIPSNMNYTIPVLRKLNQLAHKTGLTRQALSLGYVKTVFNHESIIFGAENLAQLKENIKLWDQTLPDEFIQEIQTAFGRVDKRIIRPYTWKKLNVMAILQARMSSSRLPGKVMKAILGKPMLELQIERLRKSVKIEKLVVATSDNPEDDPIESLCNKLGISCFRGDLNDVLDRFYQTAKIYQPENIVRLTGDCPLSDPEKIDDLIDFFMHRSLDYASNCNIPKLPDGLDAEIMTFNVLKRSWEQARLPSEREHVTLFIRNNEDDFKIEHIPYEMDLSHKRWTVDEPEDFLMIKKVFEALYPSNPNFDTDQIFDFLEKNPEIEKINAKFSRNEGLKKSLDEDQRHKNNNEK